MQGFYLECLRLLYLRSGSHPLVTFMTLEGFTSFTYLLSSSTSITDAFSALMWWKTLQRSDDKSGSSAFEFIPTHTINETWVRHRSSAGLVCVFFFLVWTQSSILTSTLRRSHQKKFLEKNIKYLNKSERFRVFHLFLLFSVGWKYQSVNLNLPTISTKLPFVQIRPRLCLYCCFNFGSCFHGCTWGEFIVYLCRQGVRYAQSEILICFKIPPPPSQAVIVQLCIVSVFIQLYLLHFCKSMTIPI